MIKQRPEETRKEYLVRVTIYLLRNTIAGEEIVGFDEAKCDGYCLADDLETEFDIETE